MVNLYIDGITQAQTRSKCLTYLNMETLSGNTISENELKSDA